MWRLALELGDALRDWVRDEEHAERLEAEEAAARVRRERDQLLAFLEDDTLGWGSLPADRREGLEGLRLAYLNATAAVEHHTAQLAVAAAELRAELRGRGDRRRVAALRCDLQERKDRRYARRLEAERVQPELRAAVADAQLAAYLSRVADGSVRFPDDVDDLPEEHEEQEEERERSGGGATRQPGAPADEVLRAGESSAAAPASVRRRPTASRPRAREDGEVSDEALAALLRAAAERERGVVAPH